MLRQYLLVSLVGIFSSFGHGQPNAGLYDLRPTAGPEGGEVNDLVKLDNPGNVALHATSNGVFYSFQPNPDLPNVQFYKIPGAFVVNELELQNLNSPEPKLLCGTEKGLYGLPLNAIGEAGLQRIETLYYTDLGGEIVYPNITSLEVNGDTINAIGDGRLFYSHDGGETWNTLSTSPFLLDSQQDEEGDPIIVVAYGPFSNVMAGYSEDGGIEYETINEGLPSFIIDLASTGTGTYVVSGGMVYKADYESGSWSLFFDEFEVSGISSRENYLFVTGSDGEVSNYSELSMDWSTMQGLPDGVQANVIDIYSEESSGNAIRALLGSRREGAYVYTDSREFGWERSIDGLVASDVKALFAVKSEGELIAATSNGEVHRTSDGGESWEILGRLPGEPTDIVMTSNEELIATITTPEFSNAGPVFRSTDMGANWTMVLDGSYNHLAILDGGTILVADNGTNTSLKKSTNGGLDWTTITGFPEAVNSLFTRGDAIYLTTYNNQYFSGDAGTNWSILGSIQSNAIAAVDEDHVFTASNTGIFKYDGQSENWNSLDGEFSGNLAQQINVIGDSILVAGFFNGAVYQSIDKGETWNALSQPDSLNQIRRIAGYMEEDTARIFVAPQGSAVWRNWAMPQSGNPLGIVEVIGKRAIEIMPYPNPAAFEFTVDLEGLDVRKLVITDLEGSEIKRYRVSSQTTFRADISDLSTGVYIIRLLSERDMLIGKGRLVKSR